MANTPQELIDAQLDNLALHCLGFQKEIRELKIRRNTYAPISKLPDEVLLEIFALTQIRSWSEHTWYREVTHVCRHWRYLAIEAPTLWTNLPLAHHDLAMLMLERSKSAKLTVRIDRKIISKTIEKVLDCIHRIENLDIQQTDLDNVLVLLVTGSRRQAPQLRRLTLDSWSDEHWDSRPLFALSTFCRLDLLRGLGMVNVILDWNILPLPNLVSLEFSYISLPTQVSVQKLLDTLRQMPHLENLQMPISHSLFSLAVPTTARAMMTPSVKLVLPRLRRLKVDNSNFDCLQHFLVHITAPRLQQLYVAPSETDLYSGNYSEIVQAVAPLVTCGDFGTFYSLHLHCSRLDLEYANRSELPCVRFGIGADRIPEGHFTSIVMDIIFLCRANLTHLVVLYIATTVDDLYNLSTVLSSVSRIYTYVFDSDISALISVLTMLPPHQPAQSIAGIAFPALQYVLFSAINFYNNLELFDALCDCLMLRYEYGFEIHTVDLLECPMSRRQLALLKEIVVDVNLKR